VCNAFPVLISLFNNEIGSILDIINTHNKKLAFVVGDFNIDLKKKEKDVHTPTSEFLNNFSTHSFIPTILYPTRITDTSSTLIYNIFVNNIVNSFDTAIIYIDISDHFPTAMQFDTILQKPKLLLEFSQTLYTPQTTESFTSTISEIDWKAICLLSTQCDNSSYFLFSFY